MKQFLFLILLNTTLYAVQPNTMSEKVMAEKVARSWLDFGKQVIIDSTLIFAGCSLYDTLKKHSFSRNSPCLPLIGLILVIGGWRLSRDAKEIVEVLPHNYNIWASIWGIILGGTMYNNAHTFY